MSATPEGRLTEKEREVVDHIADAYRAFAEFEIYHPADADEFVFHVHALGRIILARAACRAHPERPWIKSHSGPN